MNIAVIGAGAWGTTIADLLAKKAFSVKLWCLEQETADHINKGNENNAYLPKIKLAKDLSATMFFEEAVEDIDAMVLSVPTQFLRQILDKNKNMIPGNIIVLNASKGIEGSTLMRPSQIIEEVLERPDIAALSGPNLSKEIASGLPAATVVASNNPDIAERFQEVLRSHNLRVYTSTDIIGVELGGALKNVIAIAAGACDGLNLGNNAKSALIVRGIAEITRLGIAAGAKAETFAGLSGIGDLITTCESDLSRNHFIGEQLAKGKRLNEILSSMKAVAEGVETTRSAYALSQKLGVEMPITNEVNEVLFNAKDIKEAVLSLMTRTPKNEA